MVARAEATWVVDNEPDARFRLYTRGNVGEVFPTVVSPLTWSLYGAEAEKGWRDAYRLFGVYDEDDFGESRFGILGIFGGYCYLNASYIRVVAVRTPGLAVDEVDRQFFGESEAPPYDARPGDRNMAASVRVGRTLARVLRATELPHLETDKATVAAWLADLPAVEAASDEELVRVLLDFQPLFRRLFKHHILTTFQASVGPGLVTRICSEQLGDPTLPTTLLGGIGSVESAEPSLAMWGLGRMAAEQPAVAAAFEAGLDGLEERLAAMSEAVAFNERFADFLGVHGSRGPNEWEGSSPTWGTHPRLALAAVDRMRVAAPEHSPRLQRQRLEAERLEATAQARARLRRPARWVFDRALRSAHLFSQGRERSKTTVIRAVHGVRLAQRELARRARDRGGAGELGDMWLVTIDELRRYLDDPPSMRAVIDERRTARDRLQSLVPPFVFHGHQPPPDTWEPRRGPATPAVAGVELRGIPGCPGVGRGRARVVLDPMDPRGVGPGEVLVAPITDPSWTPLFVPAEAVVVDVGAQMSHAVIVSRELGIPAVVSVTGATATIPDGAVVEVDGTNGVVRVVELPVEVSQEERSR